MLKTGEKVITVIPARGGSKGVPRKNLKLLGGKPLIAWPIELAKAISRIDGIIVSTEDQEIANIATHWGAEVPFLRPKELAGDEVPTTPVVEHTALYLVKTKLYKSETIMLLLYATSPFMRQTRIEEVLDIFESTQCKSVIGVQEDYGRFWREEAVAHKYLPLHPLGRPNRQYYRPLYREAGNLYATRAEVLLKKHVLIDADSTEFVLMQDDELLDIDVLADFRKAEDMIGYSDYAK